MVFLLQGRFLLLLPWLLLMVFFLSVAFLLQWRFLLLLPWLLLMVFLLPMVFLLQWRFLLLLPLLLLVLLLFCHHLTSLLCHQILHHLLPLPLFPQVFLVSSYLLLLFSSFPLPLTSFVPLHLAFLSSSSLPLLWLQTNLLLLSLPQQYHQ